MMMTGQIIIMLCFVVVVVVVVVVVFSWSLLRSESEQKCRLRVG